MQATVPHTRAALWAPARAAIRPGAIDGRDRTIGRDAPQTGRIGIALHASLAVQLRGREHRDAAVRQTGHPPRHVEERVVRFEVRVVDQDARRDQTAFELVRVAPAAREMPHAIGDAPGRLGRDESPFRLRWRLRLPSGRQLGRCGKLGAQHARRGKQNRRQGQPQFACSHFLPSSETGLDGSQAPRRVPTATTVIVSPPCVIV